MAVVSRLRNSPQSINLFLPFFFSFFFSRSWISFFFLVHCIFFFLFFLFFFLLLFVSLSSDIVKTSHLSCFFSMSSSCLIFKITNGVVRSKMWASFKDSFLIHSLVFFSHRHWRRTSLRKSTQENWMEKYWMTLDKKKKKKKEEYFSFNTNTFSTLLRNNKLWNNIKKRKQFFYFRYEKNYSTYLEFRGNKSLARTLLYLTQHRFILSLRFSFRIAVNCHYQRMHVKV